MAEGDIAALHGRLSDLLPAKRVRDAGAWAGAILGAMCAVELPLTPEVAALLLAKVEQESSFDARGVLPNQPDPFRKLAYRMIDDILTGNAPDLAKVLGAERTARVIGVIVDTLRWAGVLDRQHLRAMFDGYHVRFGWERVTTEWHIEHVVARDVLTLAEESTPAGLALRAVLALMPEWRTRLASGAVLGTIGPLQVGVGRALRAAVEDGHEIVETEMRRLLYTVDGGIYYGVRGLRPHILANIDLGPLSPEIAGFVLADRATAPFASRNAAVLFQVSRLVGKPLPPDASLRSDAVRRLLLGLEHKLVDASIAPGRRAEGPLTRDYAGAVENFSAATNSRRLVRTPLYAAIRQAYESAFGEPPPVGLVPQRQFYSAKNGRYSLRALVTQGEQRYMENCKVLGCSQ